jgi:ribosomal protein S21
MGLEIKKEKGESVSSLIRRFTKAVQQSGILIRAREKMYRDRNVSEEKKKRSALRREEMKKKYEKLKKLGAIK